MIQPFKNDDYDDNTRNNEIELKKKLIKMCWP